MEIENVILKPVNTFQCEIGYFLANLEQIRKEWRNSVKDLSRAEIAKKILPDVQPIGTIIIHIAEAEYFWIQEIVSGKQMTDEIKQLLRHDLWFKDFEAENLDVNYCLRVIEKIHCKTKETLSSFTDDDLEKTFVRKRKDKISHYSLRWIFTNLLDHEGTHKGQILMIKRLINQTN